MSEEQFKLPQTTYENLCQIIQAYGTVDKPAPLSEISKVIGKDSSEISRNSGFLLSVGLIEGGKVRVATEIGRQLARALDYGNVEDVKRLWRSVAEQSDFLQKIVSSIRIRNGMPASSLQSHIAYSADEKKSARILTGASTIITILVVSGLISENDGNYSAQDGRVGRDQYDESEFTPGPPSLGEAIRIASTPARPSRTIRQSISSSVVNININIACTPEDLPELGDRVRQMMNDLEEAEGFASENTSGDE